MYLKKIGILACCYTFILVSHAKAQDLNNIYKDTFFIKGSNTENVWQYIRYYIDTTNSQSVDSVYKYYQTKQFKKWSLDKTFNVGINKHPLWLHITLQNKAEVFKKYWWSIYSSSDSIIAYRKDSANNWKLFVTTSALTPISERDIPVRFPTIELNANANESFELLVKINDSKTVQYFVTDITTPVANLIWETHFHWNIGLFIGCFIFFLVLLIPLFIIFKRSVQLYFGLYLLIATIISLKEEYLTGELNNSFLFSLLNKLHGLPLAILAIGLFFLIIRAFIKTYNVTFSKYCKYLKLINDTGISIGLISLFSILFFPDKANLSNSAYLFFWQVGPYIILLMCINVLLLLIFIKINVYARFCFFILTSIFQYFSIAAYYLNYTGVFPVYSITYPNYHYIAMILSVLIYATFLALQLKKIADERLKLQKDFLELELRTQLAERKRIAQDLHDDIGATISTINLIVTKNYLNDKYLVGLVKKSVSDIRIFSKKFSLIEEIKDNLSSLIKTQIDELNKVKQTQFSFLIVGDEISVDDDFKKPIIRITFELLTNVLKHAQATTSLTQLIFEKNKITVIVEDDGIGFEVEKRYEGNGLKNITSRANKLAAKIDVSSNSAGTTTIIQIPLKDVKN